MTMADQASRFGQPEKICDIVLKGGITSGVVYPLARASLHVSADAGSETVVRYLRRCLEGENEDGTDHRHYRRRRRRLRAERIARAPPRRRRRLDRAGNRRRHGVCGVWLAARADGPGCGSYLAAGEGGEYRPR